MASNLIEVSKTLDQLEGTESSTATVDSYLGRSCYRLRTKPVGELSVEDLRIMIGQAIGLPFLVPLALDVLDRELLPKAISILEISSVRVWESSPVSGMRSRICIAGSAASSQTSGGAP
jgi:hypothetical protein